MEWGFVGYWRDLLGNHKGLFRCCRLDRFLFRYFKRHRKLEQFQPWILHNLFLVLFRLWKLIVVTLIRPKFALLYVLVRIKCYLFDKLHKPSLVKVGLLSRNLFLSNQTFKPVLTSFASVPCLHVVDQTNMVELVRDLRRRYSLELAPEILFLRLFCPFYSNYQHRVVYQVEVFQKQSVLPKCYS